MRRLPLTLLTPVGMAIEMLRRAGSSLIMNWSEDTDCWEVDWITAGKRYRGISNALIGALIDAESNAARDLEAEA